MCSYIEQRCQAVKISLIAHTPDAIIRLETIAINNILVYARQCENTHACMKAYIYIIGCRRKKNSTSLEFSNKAGGSLGFNHYIGLHTQTILDDYTKTYIRVYCIPEMMKFCA